MPSTEPNHPEEPRRPTKPRRGRQFAKRLALLGGTVLLLALCAEIFTRLFTDTIPPLTVKDPLVGQHYIRSFEATVYVPEADRKVLLRFNRAGFRGPDRPFEKPEGVRRIAILGDSMVASMGVDEEDTMVCRLERMLNESHPEVKWEVFNFGVSGASPGQEMVLYRELVSRWDPDVVLCGFFVGNDLADNCSRLSHNPRIYFDLDDDGNLYQLPFSAKRASVNYFLNRYSRFYVWQRVAVNGARHKVMRRAGVLSPGEWIFCRNEPHKVAHAWKLCDAVNRAFRQEVEIRGGRFAVLLIPSARQIYQDAFQSVVQKAGKLAEHFDQSYPDQRMAELCREAGIPLLTMTDDFRRAAPGATTKVKHEWLFHQGTGHFNERGNLLAARAVHRFLTGGHLNALDGDGLRRGELVSSVDTRVQHGNGVVSAPKPGIARLPGTSTRE